MKIDRLFAWCATLGPIGYLPASGSWATLVTLLIVFLFSRMNNWWYSIATLALAGFSYLIIKQVMAQYSKKDPSEIVLDELVGCLVTFFAVPISPIILVAGFLLFRFFDITKLGPIGWFEKVDGAAGILLDDIAAGFISNLILQLVCFYVYSG